MLNSNSPIRSVLSNMIIMIKQVARVAVPVRNGWGEKSNINDH